jgi:hypothetical protein
VITNHPRRSTVVHRAEVRILALAAAGAAVAGLSAQPAQRFVIVNRGEPTANIVISIDAGAADQRAADMLQSAIRAMSGATVPIIRKSEPGTKGQVVIGFSGANLPPQVRDDARGLRADGFVVATAGGNLYVVSGGHKGSVYGVVSLLERHFGCRRFSPTVAVFPARRTLGVPPGSHAENPVNELRIVNGDFSRDPDYRDWLRLDVTDDVFGRGYYVHTFGKLVPWETYFAEHPEYFAWLNGKRIKDQPCLTRPEVLEIAVARLGAEIAAQPDRHLWSVSQNDNFSYCQCETCRKIIDEEGSPAGPIVRFVNAIAARFPDQVISTLAYQYSRQAPTVTRPAPNVQIMLCTIELNRSRPIAADPGGASFRRDIVDWGLLARNIYLWDYTVNFSHHVSPFPNLHVLGPNLRYFVENGARQQFQQTNTGAGHEFSELKGYLLARLLWNPDVDAEAVIAEFLDGYYGAAGAGIRKYIAAAQEALASSGARLDIYESPVAHADDYLSAARVSAYNALFDRAEAAVRSDRAVLERVKTARLPLQYAMLEIGKNDMFGPRGFYTESAGRFVLRPAMKRLLDAFHDTCVRNGVKTLNESGLTPDAYYQAALRFVAVQVEGNLAFRARVVAEPLPSPKYGRGDAAVLSNGVRGASDFRVHWLGWEGVDFDLALDLGVGAAPRTASIATLWDQRSWILHPRRVTCLVSADGAAYREVGTMTVDGDQRSEEIIRSFTFALPGSGSRFVKFHVEGTKRLPDWHPSAGGASWVFVDEVVVR